MAVGKGRWMYAMAVLLGASGPAAAWEVTGFGVGAEAAAQTVASRFELRGRLSGTAEQVDAIAVDDDGAAFDPGLLMTGQAVLGAELELRFRGTLPIILHGEVEGYFYSGQLMDEVELPGVDLPGTEGDALYVKTGFVRLSLGPLLTVGGGIASTTWGLGLLANGGHRNPDWDADAARFTDPYLGDVNLRALVATGPHGPAKVQVYGFRDLVREDDGLRPGDHAIQFGGGLRAGDERGPSAGLYIVRREIEARDEDTTEATAVDLAGRWPIEFADGTVLTLETELAYIEGDTDLAPSVEHPTHRLRQFGAAFRSRLDIGWVGMVFDALYASGDQNLADREQNAFKVDRNYEMGLLLFRYVLAAQTGYAPTRAGDPNLIGVPPEDIDRFPTRGGVSNTIAFFPRAFFRPVKGLEIYGGPLIALSEVPLVDPVNTNFNGGKARNAFDGEPGNYLGTELDLGVRGQLAWGSVQLRAGVEAGILFPGTAFNDADGISPSSLFGGRATLELGF